MIKAGICVLHLHFSACLLAAEFPGELTVTVFGKPSQESGGQCLALV